MLIIANKLYRAHPALTSSKEPTPLFEAERIFITAVPRPAERAAGSFFPLKAKGRNREHLPLACSVGPGQTSCIELSGKRDTLRCKRDYFARLSGVQVAGAGPLQDDRPSALSRHVKGVSTSASSRVRFAIGKRSKVE